jgi:hypothetical protein
MPPENLAKPRASKRMSRNPNLNGPVQQRFARTLQASSKMTNKLLSDLRVSWFTILCLNVESHWAYKAARRFSAYSGLQHSRNLETFDVLSRRSPH